jgi:hypothetical protein
MGMFLSGQECVRKNIALDGIDTDDMVSSRVVVRGMCVTISPMAVFSRLNSFPHQIGQITPPFRPRFVSIFSLYLSLKTWFVCN